MVSKHTAAWAATVVFLVWSAACAPPPTAIHIEGSDVIVHSVLQAGADSVLVRITRARPHSTIPGATYTLAVSGADVTIASSDGSVKLHEFEEEGPCPRDPTAGPVTAGTGCYWGIVAGGVRELQRYELSIVLPDGESVSGSTTVPAASSVFSQDSPLHLAAGRMGGALIAMEPIDLELRVSEEVAGVIVSSRVRAVFEGDQEISEFTCARNPARALPVEDLGAAELWISASCRRSGGSRDPIEADSASIDVLVAAHDTAFARFQTMSRSRGVQRRNASVGLNGALGIFSAIAAVKIPAMLRGA